MKSIRVGIIRCDTHATYFGPIMERHDPLFLRSPELIRPGMNRDTWLNGGNWYYFYTHYANARKMTAPQVKGFSITKLWDQDRDIAEVASRLFLNKPVVCDRFEEVSDGVDLLFVSDCNGDGSDHLKLAGPGLRKGVPTLVDKPFACEVKDAIALVRLADKHQTPLLSLSILRTVPDATLFRRRFAEIGGAQFGTVKGGGLQMSGVIHAISLAQHLFDNGVESVSCMGDHPLAHIHLSYGDKAGRPPCGVALNCDSGPSPHGAFYASAYGPKGAIHSGEIGDWVFPSGAAKILELAKKMVRTGKPPVPYDDMVENIAVAEAGRKAYTLGRPVRIKEVWPWCPWN
jgi:predicted dehydrogenase